MVQICLFLLTESRHIPAQLLQTGPLSRKENNPAGVYSIIDLDLSRYDRLAARFHQEKAGVISFLKSGIETRNQDFNRLIERIEMVGAESSEPILLTGPTGATDNREGLLRKANGGLLFLDEVGELGLDEQTMLLKAVEEKSFFPLGADLEIKSDFQLICGTNRNLRELAAVGRFREDLLARLDLWEFHLPGLSQRPEDIEPNLDYELNQYAARKGRHISFSREARELFLKLASGPEGIWRANFRDLSAAVMRMSTLAPGGRITREVVEEEWSRLTSQWRALAGNRAEASAGSEADEKLLQKFLGEAAKEIDLFDQAQLAAVIRVARSCRSQSEAGRRPFSESRKNKARPNDADRLRKYLASFGLTWSDLHRPEGL